MVEELCDWCWEMVGHCGGQALVRLPTQKKVTYDFLIFHHVTIDKNSHYVTSFNSKFIPPHDEASQIILSY